MFGGSRAKEGLGSARVYEGKISASCSNNKETSIVGIAV